MRTSYWNAMNGVTAMIGSLFAYGLGHIESKALYKYQVVSYYHFHMVPIPWLHEPDVGHHAGSQT